MGATSRQKPRTSAQWSAWAVKRLARASRTARARPSLRRLRPSEAPWRIELKLVGSAAMLALNSRYRGKRYATDVLSFPAPEVFIRAGILGELVLCLPVARRQAKEQGHSLERELEILLVHGLLHLLGFDHERGAKQARAQAAWERRLGPAGFKGLIERS